MAGTGHYVPSAIRTNADLEQILETSDEWITTRTGMKRRHIAGPDETTSTMAVHAAQAALDRAGLTAADIDCFVVATATPDYRFPATACLVATALGAVATPGFDIEIACSGFVYGLGVSASLIQSGMYRRVMLIGAEKLSSVTNMSDRGTAILFADGAGAVIVERSEQDCLLGIELGSDGRNPEVLYIPAGGVRQPLDSDGIAANAHCIHMEGREVFKQAVTRMVESSVAALAQAGLTAADCDFFIPHQANRRIIDLAAKQLDLPAERVAINIEEYGNTSAASIPITLSEFVASGRIQNGNILIFSGFGGGLSWGSIVWRWAA